MKFKGINLTHLLISVRFATWLKQGTDSTPDFPQKITATTAEELFLLAEPTESAKAIGADLPARRQLEADKAKGLFVRVTYTNHQRRLQTNQLPVREEDRAYKDQNQQKALKQMAVIPLPTDPLQVEENRVTLSIHRAKGARIKGRTNAVVGRSNHDQPQARKPLSSRWDPE